jgi:hypothetical protein
LNNFVVRESHTGSPSADPFRHVEENSKPHGCGESRHPGGHIALSLIVVKSFQEEKKSLFDRSDFKLDVSAYKLFFRWLANNSKGIFSPHPTLGTMLHNVGLFKSMHNLSTDMSKDIQGIRLNHLFQS